MAQEYDRDWASGFFDDYGEREWHRLTATPVDEVSLFIHRHYLKAYLRPGMRVLEIGAGAGRFTQALAELGVWILVADISRGQLNLNRKFAEQYGFVHAIEGWQQLDIRDMEGLPDRAFDAVVAYGGPLSYALESRDEALAECIRVLKPGGLLLVSVMSLWGTAHRHLESVLALTAEVNQRIISSGNLTAENMPGRQQFMHMFRAQELQLWLEGADLAILALSASNCLSTGWDEALLNIRNQPDRWEELLRSELQACAEPGCLDMGTHLVAVARKPTQW